MPPRSGLQPPEGGGRRLTAALPARYGTVEWVSLQQDQRCAYVKFASPEEASSAVQHLHNTRLCGLALSVYSDPYSLPQGA